MQQNEHYMMRTSRH